MEDQERNMVSGESKSREIEERSKQKDRLTIMIFKKVGKVKTARVSPYLLLGASLFFLFYIVATIFLTNAYFNTSRKNTIQANKIVKLAGELSKIRKGLERSKQRVTLLEDCLRDAKNQIPEPMSLKGYTESPYPKVVEIKDLKVQVDRSLLQVHFKIVNVQPQEEPVGGYIFILASMKDSETSEIWVYPNTSLKNGKPIDHEQGQHFLIQRFKTVTGTYKLTKEIEEPLIVEILVYDSNGRLIFKKVVEG
jgi:hypothetical protein